MLPSPNDLRSPGVVEIYSDGACKGNPGVGGWGALLRFGAVEKEIFGGCCLNRGCIPAKGLLQAAEVYRAVGHAGTFGFEVPAGETKIDWPQVNKRKQGVVDTLVKGLEGLLKRRKVEMFRGFGAMNADGKIVVDGQTIDSKHTIIVSGSVPKIFPGMELGPRVITSDEATNSTWESLPKSIAVIGGGVIGVEFASVYVDMGVQTTLLEFMDNPILPIGTDREVADTVAKSLQKRGLKAIGGAKVGTLKDNGNVWMYANGNWERVDGLAGDAFQNFGVGPSRRCVPWPLRWFAGRLARRRLLAVRLRRAAGACTGRGTCRGADLPADAGQLVQGARRSQPGGLEHADRRLCAAAESAVRNSLSSTRNWPRC